MEIVMADTIPVDQGNGSHERVAYDLMRFIIDRDSTPRKSKEDILTLYQECWKATFNHWKP